MDAGANGAVALNLVIDLIFSTNSMMKLGN